MGNNWFDAIAGRIDARTQQLYRLLVGIRGEIAHYCLGQDGFSHCYGAKYAQYSYRNAAKGVIVELGDVNEEDTELKVSLHLRKGGTYRLESSISVGVSLDSRAKNDASVRFAIDFIKDARGDAVKPKKKSVKDWYDPYKFCDHSYTTDEANATVTVRYGNFRYCRVVKVVAINDNFDLDEGNAADPDKVPWFLIYGQGIGSSNSGVFNERTLRIITNGEEYYPVIAVASSSPMEKLKIYGKKPARDDLTAYTNFDKIMVEKAISLYVQGLQK